MKLILIGVGLILSAVLVLAFSWLLIHILALLGVFLAMAYPLWWFLAPRQTICFSCRTKKEGEWCFLCRRAVHRSEGTGPKNFFSAVLNGSLILLFSVLSVAVVVGESVLLRRVGFPPIAKTVSFVIPTKGQYRIGEIFPMKIEIVGMKQAINAVQADISFQSENLEVVDVSTEGSFADIFIQKEINNETGFVRLTGGLPNPGFFSDRGEFGTVYFKGKKPGVVKIEFLLTSMVLANDGRGTNVLKNFPAVSYLILPEAISKAEDEMQKKIVFKPTVLGESTDGGAQMLFFTEEKVLGTNTQREAGQDAGKNWQEEIISVWGQVDSQILTWWGKVLSK